MRKGPIILVLLGLGILAFLYFSPVVPANPASEEKTEEVASANEEVTQELTPDQKVDAALAELESGTLPPMQAIMKLRAIAEEHPDNVKASFTMGLMSMKTGQYEKAIGRFENVLRVDAENIEALQFIADAHLNLGDTLNAKEYLSKALELSTEGQQRENINGELEKLN